MRQQIENTTAFKNLDPTRKLIYQKRSMMQQVERQYIVAKTIGVKRFIEVHHPPPYNLEVIKELLENEENHKENQQTNNNLAV